MDLSLKVRIYMENHNFRVNPPWLDFIIALLLTPAAWQFGIMLQQFKLPKITGYLTFGLLCGPQVFGLLTTTAKQKLLFVEDACLSFIAFAAGSELLLAEIRKNRKAILSLTLSITAFTFIFVTVTFVLLSPKFAFTSVLDFRARFTLGTLAGTLMVARSPATAIAILAETQGKGPFCSLTLIVIVVKDVLVVVLFALNVEIVKIMMSPNALISWSSFVAPFFHIILSAGMGFVGGWLIKYIIRLLNDSPNESPSRIRLHQSLRSVFLLGLSFLLWKCSELVEAEPLLACLVSGITVSNFRAEELQQREHIHHTLSLFMPLIQVAFFSLAGASLKVMVVANSLAPVGLIFLSRLCSLYFACWLGGWTGGCPADHTRVAWMAYITQAGVALGLAKTVANRFPIWGPEFSSLMIGVIVLNQLIGPGLFKNAIIKVGEAHAYLPAPRELEVVVEPPPPKSKIALHIEDVNIIAL